MKKLSLFFCVSISAMLLCSADIADRYVVFSWNDLGMHCSNKDFSSICVLPPYNNLYAHVIKVGNATTKPQKISTGITVTYEIPGNTYSVGKTNFWAYEDRLFGVNLQDNIGLTGKGLSGNMDAKSGYYIAEGIPITPYTDANLQTEDPYQQALIKVFSGTTLLNSTKAVIPVSNEINCVSSGCHPNENHILDEHPDEGGFNKNNKPILCASCHASNALGTTGQEDLPSLSEIVHKKHGSRTNDCYKCHPGPNTQCHRDVMYQNGKRCQDCHGSVANVALTIKNGRNPWFDEPKCGSCHEAKYAENEGKLYRNSQGHSGLYCSTCHGSPHAIVPSLNPRDNEQNTRYQGFAGSMRKCITCHGVNPEGTGPHGLSSPGRDNDAPRLTATQSCNGNITIKAKDYPEDDFVRTNIAAVRLDNSVTTNYALQVNDFVQGEPVEMEFNLNLGSPASDGFAKVTVFDLQGNTTTMEFEYIYDKFKLTPKNIDAGYIKSGELERRECRVQNYSHRNSQRIEEIKLNNNAQGISLDLKGLTFPRTLPPDGEIVFDIVFNYSGENKFENFIDVRDSCGKRYQSNLKVEFVKPVIEVSNISFGEVKVGTNIKRTFSIKNTSKVPLKITSYTGPILNIFQTNLPVISVNNPLIIHPESSYEGEIEFNPSEPKSFKDSIVFFSDAERLDNVLLLTGTGSDTTIYKPVIDVSDISFSDVQIGYTSEFSFQIRNTGNANLQITSYSGPDNDVYKLIHPLNYPFLLSPNSILEGKIEFKPLEAKDYIDSIIFISDAEEYDNILYLYGKGIDTVDTTGNSVIDKSDWTEKIDVLDRINSDGSITLKFKNIGFEIREIVLVDASGAIILRNEFPTGLSEDYFTFNMNGKASGMYLINLKTKDKRYTMKFIKLR